MKTHNATRMPSAPACHPDVVRDGRLRIPEIEAVRPFDEDASTSHYAADKLSAGPRAYTAEMLRLMLSDCCCSIARRKAELAEIEPARVMLTEEIERMQALEQGILDLIASVSPELRSELDLNPDTKSDGRWESSSRTSVWSLIDARVRARRSGKLD